MEAGISALPILGLDLTKMVLEETTGTTGKMGCGLWWRHGHNSIHFISESEAGLLHATEQLGRLN